MIDSEKTLRIVYRNHRDEVGVRRIRPLALWYGVTEWHSEPQWLLKAVDLDKNAERDFALLGFLTVISGGAI